VMAQFEFGQLKSETKTALHNEMWISIFHFYRALFYHRRKFPTKSPTVQLPYSESSSTTNIEVCLRRRKHITITYHALTTFIHRMLEITILSLRTWAVKRLNGYEEEQNILKITGNLRNCNFGITITTFDDYRCFGPLDNNTT
jgi:hypothetical protein